MKLSYDQLFPHLMRHLVPVYLVAGEEILFIQEAVDAIRAAAHAAGFQERLSYTVDSSFDWSLFRHSSCSGSLFSDKQCLELRLTSPKLNEVGKSMLLEYLQHPPATKLLLLVTGKLDAVVQKSAWLKAIEQRGVIVTLWPLPAEQIPQWLGRRLQRHGFQAEPAAIEFLAACTQGNLLAAAQQVEKLALLYSPGRLTLLQVRAGGADNARYDVFDLTDVILQGNGSAILRILTRLQEEGVEPTLILWALTRELRQLLRLAQMRDKGQSLAQLLNQPAIFAKRRPWLSRTLQQHSLAGLRAILVRASYIDRMIKGVAVGKVWEEFAELSLAIAAVRLPHWQKVKE